MLTEIIDDENMEIEKETGERSENSGERREKASDAGTKQKKHNVRKCGQDDEVSNQRKKGKGAKIIDEDGRAGEAGGGASDEHRGEPRRIFAAIKRALEARGYDKNTAKRSKRELPTKVEEIERAEKERKHSSETDEAKRSELAADVAGEKREAGDESGASHRRSEANDQDEGGNE